MTNKPRCTHYAGVCDSLVCDRIKASIRRMSRFEFLCWQTRTHGAICPCDLCKELRAL